MYRSLDSVLYFRYVANVQNQAPLNVVFRVNNAEERTMYGACNIANLDTWTREENSMSSFHLCEHLVFLSLKR